MLYAFENKSCSYLVYTFKLWQIYFILSYLEEIIYIYNMLYKVFKKRYHMNTP